MRRHPLFVSTNHIEPVYTHSQISWFSQIIYCTGLFLIGHTCHRIENGGGPRNISNPESGNSILLGTGASPPESGNSILLGTRSSPPVSGNSILDTNTKKEI